MGHVQLRLRTPKRPHDLEPEQLTRGFHEAACLNRQALPAGPLHHGTHGFRIAGHLLGGDGGMHQEHQAGLTQQPRHWQTFRGGEAGITEAILQIDLAAAA